MQTMGLRRPKKLYLTHHPILITTNVENRLWLFDEQKIAQILSEIILNSESVFGVCILAYVIMPDHLHLLIKTNEKNISEVIKSIKSFSYNQISKYLGIKDKFWQKSFDFRIKDTKQFIWSAINYIKNNPRKAKLSEKYFKEPYMYINELKIKQVVVKSNQRKHKFSGSLRASADRRSSI